MARKAQAVFTDLNLFKNELQNAVIHTGTTLPAKVVNGTRVHNGIDGQLFNLKSNDTANDNQAGLYVFKGNSWRFLPTTESIEQSIKDSVKGLKPKGSVDFTNWVEVPRAPDAENASNSALKIGESNQYRTSYTIPFRKLTTGENEELKGVGDYLDRRFNYDKGVDGTTKVECPWNIDLGEDAIVEDGDGNKTIKDTFTFVNKTILLKDTLTDDNKKEYGAYKVWKEDKSDPANWKLHIHRTANFSGEAVDDGTTNGRPASDTEKDATNVYLFVQKGQKYVHKDVSFVQTNDAIVEEKELSFQQFSGAQDGLSASGSLRISGGNTVEAVISKTEGETSEVLVTYDTLEKIEITSKLVATKTQIRTVSVDKTELSKIESAINDAIKVHYETEDTPHFQSLPDKEDYEIVSVEIFYIYTKDDGTEAREKVLVGVDVLDQAKVEITYNTVNSDLAEKQVAAEVRYRLSGDVYGLLKSSYKTEQWQQ